MKIKFNYFNNETDCLEFTIGDIAEFERIMGKSVYKIISEDDFSIRHVIVGLPLCFRRNGERVNADVVNTLLEGYIQSGGNFLAIIGEMVMALLKSGLYPNVKTHEVESGEKKSLTHSKSGYPRLKR